MKKPPSPPEQTPTSAAAGDRIAKVLARAGVASRRDAERMIEEGRVAVNGKVIDSPALNVTAKDRVTVDDAPLAEPEAARLWMYYKPIGLVTTNSDEKGRETIFDKLPEDLPRVLSVGRLDLNSEGLLLLTNDGGIKRKLELPSTGWLRKYRVRVNGTPTEAMLEPLRAGIVVDGQAFQPMQVTLDRQQGANAWLTVGLREGKNREIRRAMSDVGLTVNRLIRVSYGPFQLGQMNPGEVIEVRPKVMRDQLGLEGPPPEKPQPTRTRKPGPGKPGRSGKPGPGPGRPGLPRDPETGKPMARAGGPKTAGRRDAETGRPAGRFGAGAGAGAGKPMGRRDAETGKPAGRPGAGAAKTFGRRDPETGKPMARAGAGTGAGKPMGRRDPETGKPAGRTGPGAAKTFGRRDPETGKPMARAGAGAGAGKPMGRRDAETGTRSGPGKTFTARSAAGAAPRPGGKPAGRPGGAPAGRSGGKPGGPGGKPGPKPGGKPKR